VTHYIVVGELACGSLHKRQQLLKDLQDLPSVLGIAHNDILRFIENQQLYSRGVGYNDFHLIAAVKAGQADSLWTADKRLHVIARELEVAFV